MRYLELNGCRTISKTKNSPDCQGNIGNIRPIIDFISTAVREFYFPENHINNIRGSLNNIQHNVEYLRNRSKSSRIIFGRPKIKTEKSRSPFFIGRVEN